jgi:hypothetical protein
MDPRFKQLLHVYGWQSFSPEMRALPTQRAAAR